MPGCDAAPAPTLDLDGFNVGDLDQDGYLDDGETWTYTCSFVTGGHADAETDVTNTATANGTDFDGDALDEATSNETSVTFEHDAGTLTIDKEADVDSVAARRHHHLHPRGQLRLDRRRACRLGERHDAGCDAAPAPTLDLDGFNVGDLDQDGYLDDGETWTYTCSFVTGGHADAETDVTNTAIANGTDFDGDALDEATSNETSVTFEHTPGEPDRLQAHRYRPGRQLRRDRH